MIIEYQPGGLSPVEATALATAVLDFWLEYVLIDFDLTILEGGHPLPRRSRDSTPQSRPRR